MCCLLVSRRADSILRQTLSVASSDAPLAMDVRFARHDRTSAASWLHPKNPTRGNRRRTSSLSAARERAQSANDTFQGVDQVSASLTRLCKKITGGNSWPITRKRSTLRGLGRNAMLTWSYPMIKTPVAIAARTAAGSSFAQPSSGQSDRYPTSIRCNGLRHSARTASRLPRST